MLLLATLGGKFVLKLVWHEYSKIHRGKLNNFVPVIDEI